MAIMCDHEQVDQSESSANCILRGLMAGFCRWSH